MKILGFHSFLVEHIASPHALNNCNVVIDAQNLFYNFYDKCNLPFNYGAECDEYAKYLKKYLSMFKEADIECYFVFKGGTKTLKEKKEKTKERLNSKQEIFKVNPMFMADIHVQVLNEMQFNYMFSENVSKDDCITLARRLACPVISNDVEFVLSGVQYIPRESLELDEKKSLGCKLMSMNTFYEMFKEIDQDKLSIFILLTDKSIFPQEPFKRFLRQKGISEKGWQLILDLLRLLSQSTETDILKEVLNNTALGKDKILKELSEIKQKLRGEVNSEVAVNCFFHRQKIMDWFVSGVALNTISKDYIDMYRHKTVFTILYNSVDYTELSLDILKYAFDLLTAFENDGLNVTLIYNDMNKEISKIKSESIKKPTCVHKTIFENGWDNIRSFGLFQHFIAETIKLNCISLENVSDDAKMLMITLVYIYRQRKVTSKANIMFTDEMAYGVLLSYVMLGVVQEHIGEDHNDGSVTVTDCEEALNFYRQYKKAHGKCGNVMDLNLRTALMQFEFCLTHMNYLNKLCGSPFECTSYRKTYNGTFVYKIIHTTQDEGVIRCVENSLKPASTVFKYYLNVIEIYNSLL